MAIDTTGWTAQHHLDYWTDLSVQIGQGRDVTHGNRRLTTHDLSDITKMMDYWQHKLNAEKTAASGADTSARRALATWQ